MRRSAQAAGNGIRVAYPESGALDAAVADDAAGDPLPLDHLAGLPLWVPAREHNPALVDLVVGVCATAGFDPPRAPALDEGDMLAAVA